MLIYAGIDEAGYGPMLGPLCVGMAVFGVEDWAPGDPAPDLWDRLAPAVARSPAGARAGGGVPIADSKRLKLSNQSKTRHPLVHLERGVLGVLAAGRDAHHLVATDSELFASLGVPEPTHAWYASTQTALPLGNDAGTVRIDAAQLQGAMRRSGVRLLGMSVRVFDETEYNGMLSRVRSKSRVIEHALGEQLGRVRRHTGSADELRVVADRQGARTMYGDLLARCFDRVEPLEESQRASRYAVDGRHRVILHSEAEDAHLPVALASMAAKLTRELFMVRFNRHWSERIPELKPTAGYVQDARRWLRDAGPLLTAADREAMIRKA